MLTLVLALVLSAHAGSVPPDELDATGHPKRPDVAADPGTAVPAETSEPSATSEDEGVPKDVAPLSPTLRARVRDLVDDTAEMTAEERAAHLQERIDGGKEPAEVTAGLERALVATKRGESYDEALADALGPKPESSQRRSDDHASDWRHAPPDWGDEQVEPGGPQEAISSERLQAIRDYRNKHLEVRSETTYSGGGSTMYPSSVWGLGGVVVEPNPITTTRSWAVYQGAQRLDVPRYFDAVGQTDNAKDLRGRIEFRRTLSHVYYGAAAGGALAFLCGYVGSVNASTVDQQYLWYDVQGVGLATAVVGLVGGSFPAAKANKLSHDYTRSVGPLDAQAAVDAANEKLRKELGLSPEDALRVEAPRRREAPPP